MRRCESTSYSDKNKRVAPALKAMTITMSSVLTESASGAQGHHIAYGTPWMWTLAYGDREDRTPTHGYEATREAAMAAS